MQYPVRLLYLDPFAMNSYRMNPDQPINYSLQTDQVLYNYHSYIRGELQWINHIEALQIFDFAIYTGNEVERHK